MATQIVHATTVALDGRGILIIGPSGSGKSSLALELMALGATLVADDRTVLAVQNDTLVAQCPPALRGLIEARGIGILRAPWVETAEIALCVDLSHVEEARLPEPRDVTFLRQRVDLVFGTPNRHFPAAVLHYVRHGRQE